MFELVEGADVFKIHDDFSFLYAILIKYVFFARGIYNPSFFIVSIPILKISVVPILPRKLSTNLISSASSSFRKLT